MIFGGIGALVSMSMEMHGALFIFAGSRDDYHGALGMFGLSKLIHILERGFSSKLALSKPSFPVSSKAKAIGSFFALGVMNGFFPCGFVFFFAAKAAASASIHRWGTHHGSVWTRHRPYLARIRSIGELFSKRSPFVKR
jgi:uncharacterized protein